MSGTLQVGGITLGTHNSGTGKVDITNAGTATVTTLNTTSIASGAIGANVTIADGANPHGWEHIKTISYNSNVSGSQQMTNVVSSAYSAYKLIMQIGTTSASGPDLYWRFLDSSGSEITGSYYQYGGHLFGEDTSHGSAYNGESSDKAQIGRDIYHGTRGWNGEILLTGCYASSSDFPQIDGYQLNNSGYFPASPHASYRFVGHDYGSYDNVVTGFLWYANSPTGTATYVTGWKLILGDSASIQAGSWWSCYGLKLPTAD